MEADSLFQRDALYQELARLGLNPWAQHMRALCATRLSPAAHGNMPGWIESWKRLPTGISARWNAAGPSVQVRGDHAVDREQLKQLLQTFHPWRKGPFEIFGVAIDTEWRSNLKWDRLAQVGDFIGKRVLDVGCGNGYYGWRMLAEGAELVIGCDPFPLYLMQFEVLRRYAPRPERHFLMPLADDELPDDLAAFDTTLSLGVLYHRPQPLQHLLRLYQTLVSGGQLLLETLIIESAVEEALEPPGRYAKMKNVGAIPSLALLTRWLTTAGFCDVRIVDVSPTTPREQRRTDWMTFESLAEFLDPHDARFTVEGHPAPVRAVLTARRP